MKKGLNPFGFCALLLLISAVLSVMVGSSMIPVKTLADIFVSSIRGTTAASDPNGVFATILDIHLGDRHGKNIFMIRI